MNDDSAFRVPLLEHSLPRRTFGKAVISAFAQQLALAGPLSINLVAGNACAIINLLFVARGGTTQLAAAALGNNCVVMLGRLVLLGLCGALDTLAAQAWGAGKEHRLPVLLQRTVLFLWVHCLAISGAMLLLPDALAGLGQDAQLTAMVRRYLMALLPSVWLEAVSRPITRVLVARGTATPQMIIALVGLPLNVATNYLLVVVLRWEYVGAAAAMSAAAAYDLVLLLGYVAVTRQWGGVLGAPSRRALKGWRPLAVLAYPAAAMKCAESWAFTLMTLAASLLPDPCTATAAVGVSYNVYGVLFIAFVACSTAACVTVGNRLGAGDACGATAAATASLLVVPPAWGAAALVLLLPAPQAWLVDLFVGDEAGGPGQEAAERLRGVLREMLVIVAGLVLLDGVQTVLSGVIQGCGRQRAGALVNAVAFYFAAVPLALLLAFRQGLGPQGLYLGMAVGPAIQTVCYAAILLHTNWECASHSAQQLASALSSSSLQDLIRRLDPGALAGPQLARGASLRNSGATPWLPSIEEGAKEGHETSSSEGGSWACLPAVSSVTAAEELLAAAVTAAGAKGSGLAYSAKAGGGGTAWGVAVHRPWPVPYTVDEAVSWDASAECSDDASVDSQHGRHEPDGMLQLLIDHGSPPPAGAGMLAATLEHSSHKLACRAAAGAGGCGLGGARRCLVPMQSAFAAAAAEEAAVRLPSSSPPTTRGSPVGSSPTWMAGPGPEPTAGLGAEGQHGYAELPGAPDPRTGALQGRLPKGRGAGLPAGGGSGDVVGSPVVKAPWWFRFYYWSRGNGGGSGSGSGTRGGEDKDATRTATACAGGALSGRGGAPGGGQQDMVDGTGAEAVPLQLPGVTADAVNTPILNGAEHANGARLQTGADRHHQHHHGGVDGGQRGVMNGAGAAGTSPQSSSPGSSAEGRSQGSAGVQEGTGGILRSCESLAAATLSSSSEYYSFGLGEDGDDVECGSSVGTDKLRMCQGRSPMGWQASGRVGRLGRAAVGRGGRDTDDPFR